MVKQINSCNQAYVISDTCAKASASEDESRKLLISRLLVLHEIPGRGMTDALIIVLAQFISTEVAIRHVVVKNKKIPAAGVKS
ncbi:MAG: hypothetical protein GY751_19100 [Bacteroidetes bacterium]|nr:hypothetical protein [Bacteroidota bacterium]